MLRGISIGVAAVAFATLISPTAPAAAVTAPALLFASPSTVSADPGNEMVIDYLVDDVGTLPGLGGYLLSVKFDPSVLEMVTMVDGGFVTGGGNIVICAPPVIDNAGGSGVLFCTTVPLFGAPGVATAEPVVMARTLFKAKSLGSTALDLSDSYLKGPNEEAIASTSTGATVTVRAAPTATPATATPSSTPVITPPPQTPSATAAVPRSTEPDAGTLSNVRAPSAGKGVGASNDDWRLKVFLAAGALGLVALTAVTGWMLLSRRVRDR